MILWTFTLCLKKTPSHFPTYQSQFLIHSPRLALCDTRFCDLYSQRIYGKTLHVVQVWWWGSWLSFNFSIKSIILSCFSATTFLTHLMYSHQLFCTCFQWTRSLPLPEIEVPNLIYFPLHRPFKESYFNQMSRTTFHNTGVFMQSLTCHINCHAARPNLDACPQLLIL